VGANLRWKDASDLATEITRHVEKRPASGDLGFHGTMAGLSSRLTSGGDIFSIII
jgi:hypothetical protein